MTPKSLLALAAALALTACGSRSAGPPMTEEQRLSPIRATTLYTEALATKEKSGCAEAMKDLSLLASWGRGYEVAQYHLGDCYLELAKIEVEPERAASLAKGFEWLALAANSANVDAQGRLAELYLHGVGTAPDPAEAGKWYLLNQRHSIRREIGAKDVPFVLVQELERDLTTAEWTEARLRADAFVPVVQELKAPYPDPEKMRAGDLRRRGPQRGPR
jgi:hypothetical protein